jgi:hypothetical protein
LSFGEPTAATEFTIEKEFAVAVTIRGDVPG